MATTPEQLDSAAALDAATATIPAEQRFESIVSRLNRLSVEKRFEAFVDLDWESTEFAIDADDPRWELWGLDEFSRSEWYRSQPPEVRSRIGLHRLAQAMHTGWQFENILQVGLLIHAMSMRNDSNQFRYLHHELTEESHHSMMFHEFVRRTGLPAKGMSRISLILIRPTLMLMAKWRPIVFFMAALAGEEPADYLQRRQLKMGYPHPLIERITHIHVTEEARHISFAQHYMRKQLPKVGHVRRGILSVLFPIIMVVGARLMLLPGRDYRKDCGIPRKALKAAYRTQEAKLTLAESVARAREFAAEVGLLNPTARFVWRAIGGDAETIARSAR